MNDAPSSSNDESTHVGNKKADNSGVRRRKRLTPEEQLQIVERVKNGESQSSIARELGYVRQRISAIMAKYEKFGAEGFAHKKRGPKAGPVPQDEIQCLIDMLRDKSPSDFGFSRRDSWTYEKAESAGTKVFGRKPPIRFLREAFKKAGVALTYDKDPDEDIFTPEFKAYVKSPLAKKIREREAAYKKRLEEQGLINRPPKIGRPTKEEAARKAAPWNGGEVKAVEDSGDDELDDLDVPDWNNLTPEEMKAMRKNLKMISKSSGMSSAPGKRVGKHRKGNQAPRKKRKGKKRR